MKTPKARTGIYLTKYKVYETMRFYIDIVEEERLIKSFIYEDSTKKYVPEDVKSIKSFDEAIALMKSDSDDGEIKTRRISKEKAFELVL